MEVSTIEQEQLLKCKMAQPDSLIIYVKAIRTISNMGRKFKSDAVKVGARTDISMLYIAWRFMLNHFQFSDRL